MKETYWQKIDHIIGPTTISDFEKVGQQTTRDEIEKFILANSDVETNFLDAGCNTGVEGYRLFKKKFKGIYFGVDSNPKAIDFAKQNLQRFRASLKVSDLESIDAVDNFFDIVLNKDVIEHAAYYDEILKELCRITKKYLILSMFIKMHDDEDFIKLEPDGYHHNRYNREKLYKTVESFGFSPPKIIYQENEDEILLFERIE